MLLFFIPIVWFEYNYISKGTSLLSTPAGLDHSVLFYIVVASFGWSCSLLMWIVALQYTTTVQASLFASLDPVILVLYLYFTTGNVNQFEWIGVAVAVTGCIVAVVDGASEPEGTSAKPAHYVVFGDLLCLVANLATVLVILTRRKINDHVTLMQVGTMNRSNICTVTLLV